MARNTTTKVSIKGDDQTKKAFDSATNNLNTFKKAAGALQGVLGPLSVAAAGFTLVSMGREVLDAADQVQKMSTRLKVSTEALSQYRFVAERSGTSFENLAKAIQLAQKSVSDARDGLSTAVRAYGELRLNVDELAAMKPEEAFEAIGDALSKIEDPARRTQVAMAIMGKSGAEMLQVFDQGAGSVRALREEADRLGVTLSQSAADKAAAAKDAMTDLDTAMKGLVQTIMLDGGLVSGLTTAISRLDDLATVLTKELPSGGGLTLLRILTDPMSVFRQPKLSKEYMDEYRSQEDEYWASRNPSGDNWLETRGRRAYEQMKYNDLLAANPNAPVPYVQMPFQSDNPYRFITPAAYIPKPGLPSVDEELGENEQLVLAEDLAAAWQNVVSGADEYRSKLAEARDAMVAVQDAVLRFYGLKDSESGNLNDAKTKLGEVGDEGEKAASRLETAMSRALSSISFEFQSFGEIAMGILFQVGSTLATSWASSLIKPEKRATGGAVVAGAPYLVGEQGPELFVPGGSGTIVPNSAMGAGSPSNINFTIQAIDARGVRDFLYSNRNEIAGIVYDVNRRGGR